MLDRVTQTDNRMLYVQDDLLPDAQRQEVNDFLQDGWAFGWKSKGRKDTYSFWHRHFAGYKKSGGDESAYDCEHELEPYPIVRKMWRDLDADLLQGHRLIRCYANGLTYGSDGTLHTDTKMPRTYTCLYYPHAEWHHDWGGETLFFNQTRDDIIDCVYPKPNRMVIFDGTIPHVARGVSRLCPVLRVTLMFKTDVNHAG